MSTQHEQILDELAPLMREAKEKKLWFYCYYQDMWFSPEEMQEQWDKGRFIWGAVNWKLRSPVELLQNAQTAVVGAEQRVKEIKRRAGLP